jgi:hypothetical protein
MLSLVEGKPVALIRDKRGKKKEIIHITENQEHKLEPENLIEILGESFLYKKRPEKLKIADMIKVVDFLSGKSDTISPKLKVIADEAKTIIEKRDKNEFDVHEGHLELLPSQDKRDCIYVAGMSGAGKSYWTSCYANNYAKIFPRNPIYLFSRKNEDSVLDEIDKLKRIRINEDLLAKPIQMEELKDSLVIFDDCDILDEPFLSAINHLRDQLLEGARSQNTYVVCCNHQILNYKHSRKMLNESNYVVIFPKCGSDYYYKVYLTKYAGFGKNEVNDIMNLKSRWVCVSNSYPRFILYEKGIFIM